jgi:hypothetical protein
MANQEDYPTVFISYSHDTVEHQEREDGRWDQVTRDGLHAEAAPQQ